jgi:polyisoprenyl-teichoic acid--peptidoglycan teichoic acid transferase
MERTSNNDWRGAPHQQSRAHQRGNSRAMVMARRRDQERTSLLVAFGLVLTVFSCLAVFTFMSQAVHNWQDASAAKVDEPVAQDSAPEVLPVANGPVATQPVRILLLGSDQRGDDRSYRTDVIVLVSIDPANLTASAVSFPRDLWVEPPTLYPMKINMIQAIGGFDAMAEMFASNFGVRPDYYVLTNFTGFTHLIDSLGGIDVNIGQPLTDSCDLPQAQGGICTVDSGVLPMDGQTALWYARSRATSSDYDRLRRAQEVVQAVFVRMMSLDALTHLPQYYSDLSQDVETNMGLGDIAPLLSIAVRLFQEPDRIKGYVINEDQATPSWSWDGMWILLPDPGAIPALLQEAGIQ